MWSSGIRDNQDRICKDSTNLFISKKFYVMTFNWMLNKDKFEINKTNLELNKLDKAEEEEEEEEEEEVDSISYTFAILSFWLAKSIVVYY